MSRVTYFQHNEKTLVGQVARVAFPNNRMDFTVQVFRGPRSVNSYWDGGSKDEYRLVDLLDLRVYGVPTSHPYFDRQENGQRCGNLEISELPPNTALVSGGTFCGKPATVRVFLAQDNLISLLPAPTDLSGEQYKALETIGSTKGGEYRKDAFRRHGLGDYSASNHIIVRLVELGLLKATKAGAISITTAGRNARSAAGLVLS